MASIVAEVLSSTGQLEKHDLHSKLDILNKQVEEAKAHVYHFLESKYKTFAPILSGSINLANKTSQLTEEVTALTSRIEDELRLQLVSCAGELRELSKELKIATCQAEILEKLVSLDEIFANLNALLVEEKWNSAAVSICKAESILCDMDPEAENELLIWEALRRQLSSHKTSLLQTLLSRWETMFEWLLNNTERIFRIHRGHNIQEVATALLHLEQLTNPVEELSSKFLKLIAIPAFNHMTSLLFRVSDREQVQEVHLTPAVSKPVHGLTLIETCFRNAQQLIDFLFSNFNVPVDAPGHEDKTLLKLIGQEIGIEFCSQFVKLCLTEALPSNIAELEEYKAALEPVSSLHEWFVEIGFLSSSETFLLDFLKETDILYANKRCRDTLEAARTIMYEELHHTIVFQSNSALDQTWLQNESRVETKELNQWESLQDTGAEIAQSPLTFPSCEISVSCDKFLNLVDSIVEEAFQSAPSCAARLLYTLSQIFELYASVVPVYHQTNLESLPYYAALAHNNCMYLAHKLLTLCHTIRPKLPVELKDSSVNFLDVVFVLRKLGAQIFLKHMQHQRQQLLAILQDGGFGQLLEGNSHFPAETEKSITRCMHLLANLQKVWQPVLPDVVYWKAIGTLINSTLVELITRVSGMEDISADAGLQLVTYCKFIANKVPLLFSSPSTKNEEIAARAYTYVSKWAKFQELLLILGASMREIEDRWAQGKGPLADHFTAEEIKQFIRALFQNTDHRATVLARIK